MHIYGFLDVNPVSRAPVCECVCANSDKKEKNKRNRNKETNIFGEENPENFLSIFPFKIGSMAKRVSSAFPLRCVYVFAFVCAHFSEMKHM